MSNTNQITTLSDFHVHTAYCGHAQGEIRQYIEKAIERGIRELGFADHLGRYYLSRSQKKKNWNWGMRDENIEKYFEEVSALREIYKERIDIYIGLEVDYIEGAESRAEEILTSLPFDYALASIHCLPKFGWKHLAQYASLDRGAIYTEYFKAAKAALSCGLFQSLAHIDFIWRYIPFPDDFDLVLAGIDETVKVAQQSTTALEINSNGFFWSKENKPFHDPFEFFLELVASRGLTVTLGSDAHEPDNVALGFDQIIPYLHNKNIYKRLVLQKNSFELCPTGL